MGRRRAERRPLPWWQETLLVLAIALVLALLLKTFVVQAFYIPSESMEPGLQVNDRILVQKVTYWAGDPERGDVVVFRDPGDWLLPSEKREPGNPVSRALTTIGLLPTSGHVVKRVIGIGGDTVRCCDDKQEMVVNGQPIDEAAYLPPGTEGCESDERRICHFTVHVPTGYLWLEGDNRTDSEDSRYHQGDPRNGLVPVDDVVGRVLAIFWPTGRARFLHRPAVFSSIPDH